MTPQEKGLSAPVIAITQVLAKNADALNLNDDQRADLAAWLEVMPKKRGAFEDEIATLRAEMRLAIAGGKPEEERRALAQKIGEMEIELIMMRSNCVDHWRSVLTPDQFAELLRLAGVQ
ncbi:Spy/CpxP family protein refolding chaperone [Aliigemmobacter aestuarii]|nr:Spy/CpxP family protein refolding chaperone [Gemmobacter aestuarii]